MDVWLIVLIGIIVLVILFCLGVKAAHSKTGHGKFLYEVATSSFTIILFSLLAFTFKEQVYKYFIRGKIEVKIEKCDVVSEPNQIWKCSLAISNFYDGSVNNRIYSLKSNVNNYNFVTCLESPVEGVQEVKQDDQYSCRYNISLAGRDDKKIYVRISGGTEVPDLSVKEL